MIDPGNLDAFGASRIGFTCCLDDPVIDIYLPEVGNHSVAAELRIWFLSKHQLDDIVRVHTMTFGVYSDSLIAM